MGEAPAPCALCGLPAPSAAAGGLAFCCPGCRNVHEILSHSPAGSPADFRDTDLFRACAAAGLIAGVAEPRAAGPGVEGDMSAPAEEFTFRVQGMWCPACSWWIEEVLRRTSGVAEARVSFGSDLATVRHLPHRVSPQTLLDRVSALGYVARRLEDAGDGAREKRGRLLRLGVSAILTANLMMISMALYGGFFADLGPSGVRYLSLPQWALATPVVFYGGWPILRRAWGGLRVGIASMDTLISVGTLSAYLYSLAGLAAGSLHLYFDTAATLVTLTLLGRALESRARERVTRETAGVYDWAGRKARLWAEGKERWVGAADVRPGDHVVVRSGERVPVDGSIVEGSGRLDESSLTGEARPIPRAVGDQVAGGALLLEGDLRVRAARAAADSAAGRMIALMDEALGRRGPAELLADRVTRWLVPAVLSLAAAAALAVRLGGGSADQALLRALTVLVITCPCSLGIATPLARVAALGVARSRGILIRNPGALERMPGLDVLALDKTGTVTEGCYQLRETVTDGVAAGEALRRAACLESLSGHTLAREIGRRAQESSLALEEPVGFEEVEGLGVRATLGGCSTTVGCRRWMDVQRLAVSSELDKTAREFESRGLTTSFVGWDGRARAVFAFGDALKAGAGEVIEKLRRRGLSLWLVSGDSPGAVEAVGWQLGIDRTQGQALPAEKVELLRGLRSKGHRVGMVGDGLNDAAALAEADVSFALGADSDFLCRSADVVLLGGDPARLLEAFDHADLATGVIRQNLFFAFLYNALAIPLALSGFLNPILAALAMLGSSLTVVANTLRITRRRSPT